LDALVWWPQLAPAFAVAVALLFGPGLVVGLGLGLRGVALVGMAPPASVTTIAVAAVLAPLAGQPWGVVPVVALTGLLALLAVAASLVLRMTGWRSPTRDPWQFALAGISALLMGLFVAAAALLPGFARSDALSQTYDANFHYNAVRLAVDSGDASSLSLGQLIYPSKELAPYPGAWHAITSLVVQLAEPDIFVAANGVSLAFAGLVWPATCVVLVRQLVGRRWASLLVAGALCGAFTALPVRILAFGVLFPNTLGNVLVPAALAVTAVAFGLAREDAIGWPRAWAALALALPGMAIAHPNTVFTFAVLAVPAALLGTWWWSGRQWRTGHRVLAVLPWTLAVAAMAAAALVLASSDEFSRVSGFDWPARMTMTQAAREVLLLAAVGGAAAWILSLLVLAGLVVAARTPDSRWLVAAYLSAAGLYVLAAGSDAPVSGILTGPWYNDAFRLAAMIPIVGAPLAVLALTGVADAIHRRWGLLANGSGSRMRSALTSPATIMIVGTAAVLALTGLGYASNRERYIADSYALSPDHARSPLVTSDELEFFRALPTFVPPEVAVAGNPWTGSGLVYAIAGLPVVFPHVDGVWDPTRVVIAERLRDVASDPGVCEAARSLSVGYALEGGEPLWPDPRADTYPGLEGLGDAPGFELVASRGETRLYRITACAGSPPVA
jgi:hypothetical protein